MSSRFGLALIAAAGVHAQSTILIEHVTLIDGTGRAAARNSCVLVQADKIARVSACPAPAPEPARHINGQGKFLIPGMMDIHIHLRG